MPDQAFNAADRYTRAMRLRPQCTHLEACRTHDQDRRCTQCQRPGALGWLYACHQDDPSLPEYNVPDLNTIPLALASHTNPFEAAASVAHYLGMKEDVVAGIRHGSYTMSQIVRLIEQRKLVLYTIYEIKSQQSDRRSTVLDATTPRRADLNDFHSPSSKDGTQLEFNSRSLSLNLMESTPPQFEKCDYQVCPACRPWFRDRFYTSVENVMHNPLPLSLHHTHDLHVIDAKIARTIGLRCVHDQLPGSFASDQLQTATTQTTDETDEISIDWTPSWSDDSMSLPGRMTTSFCEDAYNQAAAAPGPCSGHHEPVHPTPCHRTQAGPSTPYVSSSSVVEDSSYFFDTPGKASSPPSSLTSSPGSESIHYATASNNGTQCRKVAPLPRLSTDSLIETITSDRSHSNIPSADDGIDDFGVGGGVALTEEAAENERPDIIIV